MRLMTLALGALLLAVAAAPSANALVRPEWIVVRWANADCKIWHNDTNAPLGACPDYRSGEAKTRSAGRDLALSRPLAVR